MKLAPPILPNWLRRQLPQETDRYRVPIGNHCMSVMEIGHGRPILLLHGNPTWGFLYRKIACELAGEPLRLIMPDLIGLGFSDHPDAGAHTLVNHGDWVAELVRKLDLRDLIFVGQDWGGPIGLHALAREPERVAAMVILNTVVGPPKKGFKATTFHRFARMPVVSELAFRLLGFPQTALFIAQGDKSSIRGATARAYRYPLRNPLTNQAPLALARMVPDSQAHPSIGPLSTCQQFYESFDGPIEVVWGEKDPVLGGVVRWLETLRPDVPVTRTQAGHFLQEEVPGQIASAIVRVASA